VVVSVADLKASNRANAVLATFALGSCLGVTCYDPVNKVGGLLHAMLPDAANRRRPEQIAAMFLDTGVPALLQSIAKLGGDPSVCDWKVFGGARVMLADNYFNIGARNVEMMKRLAVEHQLRVSLWEVGGQLNRTIKLFLDNGEVRLRMPSCPELSV
jgi:chemotaxis protein CheD